MSRLPKIVGGRWLNSQPLSEENLKGKVVLIDFWTYSCVNCKRTIPYLKEWWRKYKEKNFVMIGIHTPEFEFEKEFNNVKQACRDLGVTWPVVLDNDYVNWNNFANRYWPAKYIADKDGKIVYEHFGEGGYEKTENIIRKLIGEEMEDVSVKEHGHGNVCFSPTPELYCGYKRGFLSNLPAKADLPAQADREAYVYDLSFDYKKPEMKEDTIGLAGKFIARSEYVESVDADSELLLRFRATEVNLVIYPVESSAVAEIYLDNDKLPKEYWGEDVNESNIAISRPTMYNLVKTSGLLEGILKIKPIKGNFRAYAFTFSGCEY
ncbi:MAG: redoxin family protein [Patescibacteria group bacterium]|mgnify:FL=1